MTFCFVGTNPNLLETPKINDIDNPVYLFAKKIFIPSLAGEDTRHMLKHLGYFMGLDFPDQVISHIHSRFGGRPFFTRQLCSEIHHIAPLTRPCEISKTLCDKATIKSQSSIKIYVDEILNSLRNFYPDEYNMLELLAKDQVELFREYATDFPEFVEHLIGYDIIVKRGDDFEFSFDIIKRTISERLPVDEAGSVEDMRSEISRRRNRLEEEIRVALFHWSNRMDDSDWENACQKCVPTYVRNNGVPLRSVAFSRRSSPLYLVDLMQFVRHSGNFEMQNVSVSDISSAISTVNKYRVDAHALNITHDQFNLCRRALDRLESIFIPPD